MKRTVSIVKKDNVRMYTQDVAEEMVSSAVDEYIFSEYHTHDLSEVILPGKKVLIKPNLVHEMNFRVKFDHISMDNPNDCFITNYFIIRAVVKLLSAVDNLEIIILECLLQSCNIDMIMNDDMMSDLNSFGNRVKFIDGRRTKYIFGKEEPKVLHNLKSEANYLDFDLANISEHYNYEKYVKRFRVTDYPPSEMLKFHKKGMHKYRIAREVIEADYIISIPKLKTHMKAGLTCAMKNFVGVVGNKECLPHHIKGSPLTGGDCYGKFSILKMLWENKIDDANEFLLNDETTYFKNKKKADNILRILKLFCLDSEITGSWYGNDTICRTIVDLNRIVYYGKIDGSMSKTPQRKIISIVDAVISGQGEGPMRPIPNYSGFIAVGESTAAVDAVCFEILGIDSSKIRYLFEKRVAKGNFPVSDKIGKTIIKCNRNTYGFSEIRKSNTSIIVPPRWEGKIEKLYNYEFNYFSYFLKNIKEYPQHIKSIFSSICRK